MNLPKLLTVLEEGGIKNPIICGSINIVNFRMSGGKELYEDVLKQGRARVIAMQMLGGGAIPPKEALEYVSNLPNVDSILFGASSRQNIENTVETIKYYDSQKITQNQGI